MRERLGTVAFENLRAQVLNISDGSTIAAPERFDCVIGRKPEESEHVKVGNSPLLIVDKTFIVEDSSENQTFLRDA